MLFGLAENIFIILIEAEEKSFTRTDQAWFISWERYECLCMDVIVAKRDSSLLLGYYNEYNLGHDDKGVWLTDFEREEKPNVLCPNTVPLPFQNRGL